VHPSQPPGAGAEPEQGDAAGGRVAMLPVEALRRYQAALADPTDERLEALGDAMAGDVEVVGMAGPGRGLEAVRQALRGAPAPPMLAEATWSEPAFDGDSATVRVGLPSGRPVAGLVFHLSFDRRGMVSRVEQQILPAPPPEPGELVLSGEMKLAVAGAAANGTPMALAYVDAQGAPHVSLRGSTQPFSDTQLAMWIRDPSGGLLQAIPHNPQVALMYRDPATRTSYQFSGRAHVAEDVAVRDAVYANSPETERNLDARRLGRAVIVDLDTVEGTAAGSRFRMERRPPT
jgi:hypothetical protein